MSQKMTQKKKGQKSMKIWVELCQRNQKESTSKKGKPGQMIEQSRKRKSENWPLDFMPRKPSEIFKNFNLRSASQTLMDPQIT